MYCSETVIVSQKGDMLRTFSFKVYIMRLHMGRQFLVLDHTVSV